MSQYVSAETKREILRKLREDNASVSDVSTSSGVSTQTIYRWLQEKVGDGNQNLILENKRLKKEVEQLYAMLGKATALMQHPKG